ncbi:MAG: hypothetical protein QXK06_00900 [Candidatus Diapherotrites archaeon]
MPAKYTGPVVFITHPLWTEARNGFLEPEKVKRQEKFHRQKILQLLCFAAKHGLPVFYVRDPKTEKKFFELAEQAGFNARERHRVFQLKPVFFSKQNRNAQIICLEQGTALPEKLKNHFNPTSIIHAGALRTECVGDSIFGTGKAWPNARQVLLTGSYSFELPAFRFPSEPKNRGVWTDRAAKMRELRASGVHTTSKLGRHLFFPQHSFNSKSNGMPLKPVLASRKKPRFNPKRI